MKRGEQPALPEGIRIYAIGDIHGRADLLEEAFTIIDSDLADIGSRRSIQVFLGDYVDRGLDSRRTLDVLMKRELEYETVFLKGNHEALLSDVLENPEAASVWYEYGGLNTLLSYGIKPSLSPGELERRELVKALSESLPDSHKDFLRRLKPSFICGDFLFVHAGVRPGVALENQKEDDLIWIREEFLKSDLNFGKFVVHGHTPVMEPQIRWNRINIDTGAYATGRLTILRIEGADMSVALRRDGG